MVYSLYNLQSGITDVRVCHPKCGEVTCVITFLTRDDLDYFQNGPQRETELCLQGIIENGPCFQTSGCLMPAAHTLGTLIQFLKLNVIGDHHSKHDVRQVQHEISKWFPRLSEYEKYIHWDKSNPKTYTRNLVFHNEHMDVILMCWPAGWLLVASVSFIFSSFYIFSFL